jgi:hypothetical protein
MDSGSPGASVVYLYGIAPAGQQLPDREGSSAGNVSFSGLVALADLLAAGEFSGPALEARLADPEWVAGQARLHTSVLAEAMEHGPVVPARLCTLFSSPSALRESLARTEDQLLETLARLRGRREWGLKLFFDEARVRQACVADDPNLAEPAPTGDAPPSGAAWMLRKRLAAQLAERVTERAEQVANDVLDETETLASEVRVRPTLSEAASGVAKAMVLNAALLVDLESEHAMGEAVEDMARELEVQGFELVLSGPWPPFTFSEPEDVVDDGEPAGMAPQESSG